MDGSNSAIQRFSEAKELSWQEEENGLFELLLPLIRKAAVAGAKRAVAGLAEMGIGVDWALVNTAAVRWAQTYTFNLVKEITGTTRTFLQEAIPEWLNSGLPLDELKAVLEPMFGEVRAEMVAVTETTRAWSEGNQAAWKESGNVDKKQWMTAEDELVCEICGPLDGMIVELDGDGFTTEEGGIGIQGPPAHVNCRCGLQPVVEI